VPDVVREIDGGHPARTELSLDAVPIEQSGDDVTGQCGHPVNSIVWDAVRASRQNAPLARTRAPVADHLAQAVEGGSFDRSMTSTEVRLATALADRYRIERELGAGGMATVFLAVDLRHDRHVAIKVLHPDLAAALGGERFLAEIKTTARLQHPHILSLLDSGAAEGLLYYVMPFVAGETLRQRLNQERQLPIDDAVRLAREVADALDYAHGHGIVHRDVKPENILLQGGHALVADFGIALAIHQAGGQRLTQTGLSLGTPQYMSPEQASGERTIDARSDVYSLGAVLYEMLTGEPPFTGATVQAVVAKVLTERPASPRVVRDTIPVSLELAVLKSLTKLPADRFQNARQFADAIGRTDIVAPPVSARPPRSSRSISRAGLAVAAAALALAGGWWLGRRGNGTNETWSSYTQLTDAAGVETSPTLSPDGESFAYASNTRGSWDIYVQRVGGRNPIVVAGDATADEVWPAYSPDGKQIAFTKRGAGIYVVGSTGESPRRLTNLGANAAWSPDGRTIAFGSEEVVTPYNVFNFGTVWVVDAGGGTPRRVAGDSLSSVYQPAWSPSGRRIVAWINSGGQRDLVTFAPDGTGWTKLTRDKAIDWAPVWSADGRWIFFASDRGGTMGIWRLPVDEKSGAATGAPVPVASGANVAMDLPQISRDGSTLVFRALIESINPVAVAFDPIAGRVGAARLLQHRSGALVPVDVSPDGRLLALANYSEPQSDIFLLRTDGTGLTRLTDDAARDWEPRFMPDGKALTFWSNPTGNYDGYLIQLDGSGRTRLTETAVGQGVAFPAFAPDGKRLFVGSASPGGQAVIATGPWPMKRGSGDVLKGLDVPDGVLAPTRWSPDGRLLSGYVLDKSGVPHGYAVYDVAKARATSLTNDTFGFGVAWLPDSRHVVYFNAAGRLIIQDVETLTRREITGALPYPTTMGYGVAMSPDGRTLYYAGAETEANIWLVRPTP
jgi:serine/threonine-protein kinase